MHCHACAGSVANEPLNLEPLYSSCLVCLSVCLSEHAILAVRAIRSITKDTIVLSVRFAAILKKGVFLKIVLFES